MHELARALPGRSTEQLAITDGCAVARDVISSEYGPGIMLRLSDQLYGSGIKAVASNHVNQGNNPPDMIESALIVFEPGPDPTLPWAATVISQRRAVHESERDAGGWLHHGHVVHGSPADRGL